MSVFVTGDCHGDVSGFSKDCFYEQKDFSGNKDENFVIICGDFGLVWQRDCESKSEHYWLDWLEDKPFTTLFVDGNHSNHKRIAKYPVKEWHGGMVHEIRPHVLHMMRGEVFNIQGKKFFVFGGASSHDISDGILDYNDEDWREKAKKLEASGKWMYRVKDLTWWEEELPTDQEMQHGLDKLKENNNVVDYIITHSPPASVIALLGQGLYEQDILTKYLENIRAETEYKYWFMGHMHVNRAINDKDMILYEQIVQIL